MGALHVAQTFVEGEGSLVTFFFHVTILEERFLRGKTSVMLIQDVECIFPVFRLLLEPGREKGERQERPQLGQQYLEVVSFFVRRALRAST